MTIMNYVGEKWPKYDLILWKYNIVTDKEVYKEVYTYYYYHT